MGSSSPSALGSLRRLWLCKGLKSAKFLADKVQNLDGIWSPGGWLSWMSSLQAPTAFCSCSPLPSLVAQLSVSLQAQNKEGGRKPSSL